MSRLTAKKNSRKVDELERAIENLRKDNDRLQEQLANTAQDLHYYQGTASLWVRKFNELYNKCMENGYIEILEDIIGERVLWLRNTLNGIN